MSLMFDFDFLTFGRSSRSGLFCTIFKYFSRVFVFLIKFLSLLEKRWPDDVKHLKIDFDWSVRNRCENFR